VKRTRATLTLNRPTEPRPLALVGRKHPALHAPALAVDDPATVYDLADRMIATLRRHRGYALAACQVGEFVNLVVLGPGMAYCNVAVEVEADTPRAVAVEECLSLPGRRFAVPRAVLVRVEAFDLVRAERIAAEFRDLDARLWQHEADHLNGVLISDRYPEVRRGEQLGGSAAS